MFVEKRPNGNFRFGEWYIDSLTGKRRRAYVTYTKNTRVTRKQAEEELREKIAKLQNRTATQRPITLQDAFDEFLTDYKNRYAHYTVLGFQNARQSLCKCFSKDTLLANLTRPDIVRYAEYLLYQENLANNTVRAYIRRLSSIYRWASKREYIPENYNPTLEISVTWKNDRSKDDIEDKFLSDEDLAAIFSYCQEKRPDMYDYLKILYLTGLRKGEASALQVKNYVQKEGVWGLEVTGTLIRLSAKEAADQHLSSTTIKTQPKTQSSNRFVSLPKKAREIIERNIKGKSLDDWIFWHKNRHAPISEDVCHYFFDTFNRSSTLSHPIHAHMFRHTHVSKLAEMGVPLYAIQDRLGHSSSKTTEAIYLHVTKKAKKDLLDKLEDL